MTNYLISYDLHSATPSVHATFAEELEKLGWLRYSRRTADNKISELPETTFIIKDEDDKSVVLSFRDAVKNSRLQSHGASVGRCIISEYRKVMFLSNKPLEGNISRDIIRLHLEGQVFD